MTTLIVGQGRYEMTAHAALDVGQGHGQRAAVHTCSLNNSGGRCCCCTGPRMEEQEP